MTETTPPLPGLSPVNGKAVTARFDGGSLSSDAGLLALREVERRLDVAGRLAACIDDPRDPARTLHSVADILRFRMMMIAAGYEDGIDANALRADPVFKMALERHAGGAGPLLAVHRQPARDPARPAHAAAHGPRYGRSTAPPSRRSRSGSRSTSTTPSTPSMAASSCGCSTPITTTTASSRLSSSTARGVSSRRCCARRSAPRAGRSPRICAG